MNKKIFTILILIIIGIGTFFYFNNFQKQATISNQEVEPQTQGIMLLIEFEDTLGLNNFVYELSKRNMPSLLLINPDFIKENQEDILKLQDYNVEIAGVLSDESLWDISYEDQSQRISEAKQTIEEITKKPLRVIGSKYFAYDKNTLKVAEELGIEYVLGRGVTGSRATIFKPEEYNVKIFSVSNINSPKWGRGSLCDYSYWAREGTPYDFEEELFAAAENYDKISPVSHTYIGGLKERWNRVYLEFFDNTNIFWQDLDQFGNIDLTLPLSEIPQNREVQYRTPKSEIPLNEEQNVLNPCSAGGEIIKIIEEQPEQKEIEEVEEFIKEEIRIVVFENSSGPMCIDLNNFLEEIAYPNIEMHLTTESNFREVLEEYRSGFSKSEGFSSDFSYYPMIFIKNRAFSGFNSEVKKSIEDIINK